MPQGAHSAMNILILSHSGGYAGSTYSITYLAKGLAARGHDVHVCCPAGTILHDNLQSSDVTVHPLSFRAGRFVSLRAIREVARIARAHHIEIINAQTSSDRYVSILARWLYHLDAAVVHTRRQTPLSSGNPLQNFLYTRGTDRIVAVSNGVRDALVALGIPAGHITVVHNGTPREKYDAIDPAKTGELRERFGIAPNDTVIGCVSRPKKQDQLFAALASLDPSWTVMLVGPNRATVEKRFGSTEVPQKIVFTGTLDIVATLHCYPLMSVHVLPSTTEGLSQSLLEAMALGVPVVATRAAGNIDLIEDGVNGLLFDDGDIDGFADAIRRAITDQALRERLIAGGRKTALEDYAIDRTIDRYETFFTGLAEGRKRRG